MDISTLILKLAIFSLGGYIGIILTKAHYEKKAKKSGKLYFTIGPTIERYIKRDNHERKH